jgi:DNA-binding transcriptional LysR family regulator
MRDVGAFVMAADTGTFTGAASLLYTTQSSISRRVARLEQEVGGSLFDRSNRRAPALSPLGEEILPHARQLLAEYGRFADLVRTQSEGRQGAVTVALSEYLAPVVLPRLYELFGQRIPGVRVRVLECAPGVEVCAAIVSRRAELGLLDPCFMSPEVEGVTFGVVTHSALGLPEFLGEGTHPIEWDAVRRLPLLLPVSADHLGYPPELAPLTVRHESGTPTTLLAMARAGQGVAILPGWAASPPLLRRPIVLSERVQQIRLQLAWRRHSALPTPMLRLVAEVRRQLSHVKPFNLDEFDRDPQAEHASVA